MLVYCSRFVFKNMMTRKENKVSKSGHVITENLNDQGESSDLNFVDLRERLELNDNFFTALIDTIPPKMFFDKETQEKIITEKHSIMDEAITALQKRKGGVREVSIKTKHKRAKLDPNLQKSISQIQQGMSNGDINIHKKGFQTVNFKRAENIEELQKRLKEKISELKSNRGGVYDEERHMKKRLKVKKLQELRKARKLQPVDSSKKQTADASKAENKETAKFPKLPKNLTAKPSQQPKPKPVFNKEGKVMFNKFEFSEDESMGRKKGKFSGKSHKKLLENVKKEKEKVDKLKVEDPSKADEFIQKKSWEKAIIRAEGIKVKDDAGLLKKSILNQAQKKRKNSKLWKERIEQTENMKKSVQEKRRKNIQKKKNEKFQAKVKRAKKKGRIISGF